MKSRIAQTLLAASFGVLAMAANAQYPAPADKTTATGAGSSPTSDKRLSESDIRLYRDGRRACAKMTGAAREDCRKQLSAKYVDKQCRNLTGMKLDQCLKAEYPGE